MSKSSPKPPTAPDPMQVANTQKGLNLATGTQNAELNRVNQANPYGSSSYQITGYNPDGTPIYSQSSQLSAPQQAILNQSQGNSLAAGQAAGGLIGGLNGAGDQTAIQQAENAAYNTQEQYLRPQQAQQTAQLNNQLVQQGLQPGTEAYRNAADQLNRNQTFQNTAAQTAAVGAGQQEQNTLYNQRLAGLGTLLGASQPAALNFSNVPGANIANTDYAGAVNNQYQGQLNSYNAQMGAKNSTTSGLFSLAGAAAPLLMMSDKDLKKDIEPVGKTPGGNKLYSFRYKGESEGKHVGVMAQELEKKQPSAVSRGPGGFRMVDYAQVR